MLIIHGTIKGRTKEQTQLGPVPILTRACGSCDDPDALGQLYLHHSEILWDGQNNSGTQHDSYTDVMDPSKATEGSGK